MPMSPNQNVVQITILVTMAEMELFTEGARMAASTGGAPNRSWWIREVALGGKALPKAAVELERKREGGNRTQLPITLTPEGKRRLDAEAEAVGLSTSGYVRAAARWEALQLKKQAAKSDLGKK